MNLLKKWSLDHEFSLYKYLIFEITTDIASIFFVVMAAISAVKFIFTNENPLVDLAVCIVMVILICLYRMKYMDTTM